MLTSQRKQLILEILEREGQVVAKDLSRELDLSEDTIRRDLRELAHDGKLLRVHGGALPTAPAAVHLVERKVIAPEEKLALGRAAGEMVRPGSVIAIDGGTTSVQIARHLPRELNATVVTHSPAIAVELAEHPGIELILIGGTIFKHSLVAVGAATIEGIHRIRTDMFFLGATGIHPESGVTTGDLEEAHVKEAFSKNAAETILLASPEKLYAASPYRIIPLERVSSIIVTSDTAETKLTPFIDRGISIVRARP